MGRSFRIEYLGALCDVTLRDNERKEIYRSHGEPGFARKLLDDPRRSATLFSEPTLGNALRQNPAFGLNLDSSAESGFLRARRNPRRGDRQGLKLAIASQVGTLPRLRQENPPAHGRRHGGRESRARR